MKRLLTLIALCLITAYSFAQIPQQLTYQAVARNSAGVALISTNISLRISIKDVTATGTTLYSETHTATTNQFGLFTLPVGAGTVVSGTFSTINWATNAKFMKVEMDPTGGASYIDMGTSQLLSVPYALVAGSLAGGSSGDNWGTQSAITNSTLSGNGTSVSPLGLAQQGASSGQVLKWNGTNWAPGADNVGSSSGSVNVTARLTGDGTLANPLDIAQQAATAGQVLKWGGSSWVPASDADAQTLNLIGNTLSLTNGGSVVLPTGTTYTAGTGINLNSNVITNTAPDQTVVLTGTGNTTVTGTYPNFTINSTGGGGAQSLSFANNNLSISGGNTIQLYTAGTGIGIAGTTISNTAPDQTVTLNSGTGISVTGSYPSFTITATGGGGGISGSGTVNYIPKFTPTGTTLGNSRMFDNGTLIGVDITTPTDFLHLNSTTNNYVGINMTNPTTGTLTTDGFYVGMNSASGDGLLYEAENQPIGIFTNSLQRMIISAAGNVGIGTVTPISLFHVEGSSATNLARFINTNNAGWASLSANTAAAGAGNGSGVTGLTYQNQGYGLWGENANTSGTGLLATGNNLLGQYLVAGSGAAFVGQYDGIYVRNTDLGTSEAIYTDNGGNLVAVNMYDATTFTQYKIVGGGTVSTIVKDMNNNNVVMHAPESPEVLFTDYGSGQLVNGATHIDLDPTFAKNVVINAQHPLRVFVQLEGNVDCKGVVVMNKTMTGFDVVELNNGQSNTSFSYEIVCNRVDEVMENGRIVKYSNDRFETAPKPKEVKTAKLSDLIETKNSEIEISKTDLTSDSKVNTVKKK